MNYRQTHRPWILLGAIGVALCAVLLTPARAEAQMETDNFNLRPDWEAGQSSRYEIWSHRERRMSMSAGGRQREVTSTYEVAGEVTWRVQNVRSDGGAVCEMTYDWLKLTVRDGQGNEQVSDTRRGAGDSEPIHDFLKAMTSGAVRITVAPDGTIANVAGTNAIRQRVATEQMRPEDLDFMESARELAVLAGAPANAAMGDSWQTESKGTHRMGYLRQRTDWRLEQVERIAGIPVATVQGEAELELEVDKSDRPDNAPPVEVTLRNGRMRSQVMFDLQRHEAVGRNAVQTTAVDVNIRMQQGSIQQRIEETLQSQVLRIDEQ